MWGVGSCGEVVPGRVVINPLCGWHSDGSLFVFVGGEVLFSASGLTQGGKGRETREGLRTSATGAESAVSMAALGTNANHLAVNVFCVVRGDVAGTATAVGDFGSRHFELRLLV